jgi:hypothetical protein
MTERGGTSTVTRPQSVQLVPTKYVNDCIIFYQERAFDKVIVYITRYMQDERAYLLNKCNTLGIEAIFKFLLKHCEFFLGVNTSDIKAYTICKKEASTVVNYFCGQAYGSTIPPKTVGTMIDILVQCVGFPINIIQCVRANRNYYQGIRWNATGLNQVSKQSSSRTHTETKSEPSPYAHADIPLLTPIQSQPVQPTNGKRARSNSTNTPISTNQPTQKKQMISTIPLTPLEKKMLQKLTW